MCEVDKIPFGIYDKKIFEKIGGYNDKLLRNHDIERSNCILKAGYKIISSPHTRCVYCARETFGQLASNNFKNGLWNILTFYVTKKMNSLSSRHYIPVIFILSLLTPLMLFIINLYFIFITFSTLIIYLILVFFMSIKITRIGTTVWHIIWTFFTLHFSYGVDSLIGIFKLKYLFK